MANKINNPENKLIILYLLVKMSASLSAPQIQDCLLSEDLMHFYTIQEELGSMVENGYLLSDVMDNITRYTLTEDGREMIRLFEEHIPAPTRLRISNYVREHQKTIQRDFETNATIFPAENDSYTVKCAVYDVFDGGRTLMDITLSVDTLEQAQRVRNNWRAHAKTSYYGQIIRTITQPPPEK